MRVAVSEFVTGGGALSAGLPLEGSLLREGRAMLEALLLDLARLPGVQVDLLRDARLSGWTLPGARSREVANAQQEMALLDRLASEADWTLLIAPEFDQLLLHRSRRVHQVGGRLLSPHPEFIELTSDKHATCRRLARAGISVPYERVLPPGAALPRDFSYPAVMKPRDGAGSLGVQYVPGHDASLPEENFTTWRCLQKHHACLPASVGVLSGPAGVEILPAGRQQLSDDGHFRYLGGELPLPGPLQSRARKLAKATVDALPPTVGYFGIDLMLGDARSGRDDVVLEVNPRLTTSYVGLQRLAQGNLAGAMLAVARGERCRLSFAERTVKFSADGGVL